MVSVCINQERSDSLGCHNATPLGILPVSVKVEVDAVTVLVMVPAVTLNRPEQLAGFVTRFVAAKARTSLGCWLRELTVDVTAGAVLVTTDVLVAVVVQDVQCVLHFVEYGAGRSVKLVQHRVLDEPYGAGPP